MVNVAGIICLIIVFITSFSLVFLFDTYYEISKFSVFWGDPTILFVFVGILLIIMSFAMGILFTRPIF